jgi:hypothetical protein
MDASGVRTQSRTLVTAPDKILDGRSLPGGRRGRSQRSRRSSRRPGHSWRSCRASKPRRARACSRRRPPWNHARHAASARAGTAESPARRRDRPAGRCGGSRQREGGAGSRSRQPEVAAAPQEAVTIRTTNSPRVDRDGACAGSGVIARTPPHPSRRLRSAWGLERAYHPEPGTAADRSDAGGIRGVEPDRRSGDRGDRCPTARPGDARPAARRGRVTRNRALARAGEAAGARTPRRLSGRTSCRATVEGAGRGAGVWRAHHRKSPKRRGALAMDSSITLPGPDSRTTGAGTPRWWPADSA